MAPPTLPAAKQRDRRLLRFLRPGALARLRDSRFTARSLHPPRLPLPRSPSVPAAFAAPADVVVPWRSPARAACGGPRFPQRKKLAASKALFVVPDPVVDVVVNGDLLLAHWSGICACFVVSCRSWTCRSYWIVYSEFFFFVGRSD